LYARKALTRLGFSLPHPGVVNCAAADFRAENPLNDSILP